MSAYVDELGEYRLLASVVDRPNTSLAYTPALFTGDRARIFLAMQEAYLAYGDLSTEGVERFYGRMLPPEIEAARGAKPAAIIDRLEQLASKRQVGDLIERLSIAIANNNLSRAELAKLLVLKPLVSNEDSSLAPGISTFVSDLGRKITKQYCFVNTGLPFLDTMMGGEWPRKALTVMLAQGGGGKTSMVIQALLKMAEQQLPALFISLEMPRDRLISRMVASITGINGIKIRNGDVTEDEQQLINAALEKIQALEQYIFIIDRPGLTVTEIINQVRLHKDTYDIQAFFVDYLQIIDRPETENTAEALGYVAQQLRNVAVNLDISAILLSQQNRGFTGLASILGSGRVGHIADVVFEILFDTNSTNDDHRQTTISFYKNRDGPVGTIQAIYKASIMTYV